MRNDHPILVVILELLKLVVVILPITGGLVMFSVWMDHATKLLYLFLSGYMIGSGMYVAWYLYMKGNSGA